MLKTWLYLWLLHYLSYINYILLSPNSRIMYALIQISTYYCYWRLLRCRYMDLSVKTAWKSSRSWSPAYLKLTKLPALNAGVGKSPANSPWSQRWSPAVRLVSAWTAQPALPVVEGYRRINQPCVGVPARITTKGIPYAWRDIVPSSYERRLRYCDW